MMDVQSIAVGLAKIGLPLLGAALAPATGGLSAAVAGLIASKIGVAQGEVEDGSFLTALQGNAEKILDLKRLEMDHQTELQEIALKGESRRLDDVANARAAHTERVKQGGGDSTLYILAYLIVTGFFGILALLIIMILTGSITEDTPQLIVGLLGTLIGALVVRFGTVIDFFFGSSKGSAVKTALLAGGKS